MDEGSLSLTVSLLLIQSLLFSTCWWKALLWQKRVIFHLISWGFLVNSPALLCHLVYPMAPSQPSYEQRLLIIQSDHHLNRVFLVNPVTPPCPLISRGFWDMNRFFLVNSVPPPPAILWAKAFRINPMEPPYINKVFLVNPMHTPLPSYT